MVIKGKQLKESHKMQGLIGGAVMAVMLSTPVQADLLDVLLGGKDPFPIGSGLSGGTSGSSSSGGSNPPATSDSGNGTGQNDNSAGSDNGGKQIPSEIPCVTTDCDSNGNPVNNDGNGGVIVKETDTGSDNNGGGDSGNNDGGDTGNTTQSTRYETLIAQANGELEPNNHLTSADPLTPGQPVKGQLFSMEDEDWYSIRTTKPRAVLSVEMPAGGAAWRLSVRDRAGNLLAVKDSSSTEDLTFSVTLEKEGDYYLVISSIDDSRNDYVLLASGFDLTNPGNRHPNPNFHDAETELNNVLTEANSIGSAVQLVGHLSTESDIDIYRLESQGDEILSVELCPGNAACASQIGEEGGPWVVYIFDGEKITQDMLEAEFELSACLGNVPTTYRVSHLYLSLNSGVFSPALLGVIDPAFGNSKRVEVGLARAGEYFIIISSPLKRDDDGSVILKEEKECGKDQNGESIKIQEQKIVIFPFSDDQYALRIVQTQLTPSIAPVESASSQANRSTFLGDVLYVPVVEANGMEYSAELRMFKRGDEIMFELLRADALGPKQEVMDTQSLQREAMKASLEEDVVHIPSAELNGRYYSGDLRMFKENGKLLFKLIRAQRLN